MIAVTDRNESVSEVYANCSISLHYRSDSLARATIGIYVSSPLHSRDYGQSSDKEAAGELIDALVRSRH